LPLYHAKAGNDVSVIATGFSHEPGGGLILEEPGEYVLDGGVRIVRVRQGRLLTRRIGFAYGHHRILGVLNRLRPDFIMMHGLLSVTALQAIVYRTFVNRRCVLVADTHLDSYNAPMGTSGMRHSTYRLSISILGWLYAKNCRDLFGVTPDCIDYAVRRHGIPPARFQLLPLGADSDGIVFARQEELRLSVREKYGIPASNFIVLSGGKLDAAKGVRQLIEAVGSSNLDGVTLVLFGSVSDDSADGFFDAIGRYRDRVKYVGFLSLDEIYGLFLAADLAAFPGSQSALWQQAIACGLPAIFKWWPGIEYLDLGGNCVFLADPDSDSVREMIERLVSDPDGLKQMASVARREGIRRFSYRSLAAQVLG